MKKLIIIICVFLVQINLYSQKNEAVSEQIPTLAWFSIPAVHSSLERYNELKESGITHSLIHNFNNLEEVQTVLKIAQEAGVKMIVHTPELVSKPEETVHVLQKYPALAGYFIVDEPVTESFDTIGRLVNRIKSVDNKRITYINLLPTYFNPKAVGVKNYEEYIGMFLAKVPTQILSFDHYPVIGRKLRKSWYENLEIISKKAKEAQKPFWAFALTTAHDNYPIPSLAELRLQVYSNLAYGAQGIQYFTYWLPENTKWNFHHSPISKDSTGNFIRTEVYDRVQVMNKEIKNLSYVFLNAEVVSVNHTGRRIPFGTKRLSELPAAIKKLETEGVGAVVSLLKKEEKHYLVIVNRDFLRSMILNIECAPSVKRIFKDGSVVNANLYAKRLEIDPGDAIIYQW